MHLRNDSDFTDLPTRLVSLVCRLYVSSTRPYSLEWSSHVGDGRIGDESLENVLKRTFRRKREKVRAQIAAKAPMGIYSSAQDRQKEPFPHFEMIDLTFDLSNLENLTSAQLAVSLLHLLLYTVCVRRSSGFTVYSFRLSLSIRIRRKISSWMPRT